MKAEVKVDFNVRLWEKESLKLTDFLTKDAAKRVVKETRRNLIRHKDITLRRGARGILGTIRFKKSKYKDKGYIAGIFKQQTAKWEDTFGAQAHFLEYGHAAPGYGKYSSMLEHRSDGAAEWLKSRKGRTKTKMYRYKFEAIEKVVAPRPFIKPAIGTVTKQIRSAHPGYVRKWVAGLNRSGGRVWFGRDRAR